MTDSKEFQRGRLAGLEEAATIAQAHHSERTGHEWVRDSLWDNIIGRIPAVIRAHIGVIA